MTRVCSAARIDRYVAGIGYHTKVVVTFACDYCQHHLLAFIDTASSNLDRVNLDDWLTSVEDHLTWLPSRGEQPPLFEDVPEHIAGAAREAYRCRSIGAHRAAVLLARSAIEATAKRKGFKDGGLNTKIDKMFEVSLIREHIRDGAHEVRHLGNDMAHGDFVEPVEPEDSELLLTLMSEVLDEVFQGPARVEKARAARLARRAASQIEQGAAS